ncbi:MAG: N-acetylmuramoyl-L-alanine amidase [Candidatus Magasanikbacteria bacterium]|nr:N-acetylmuramoyl-L-alanine amidase [Candidatus Magasanikbacteria bacterium]
MMFEKKYNITSLYLTDKTKRRSGLKINPQVKFVVAHDTGNPGSTARANVNYYENTNNSIYASAHLFVDDVEILECIPALTTDKPEKAWHVRYNVEADNKMYGDEANDTAIGIEFCYGGGINNLEAYKRYVWTIAYTCHKFGLDPKTSVVGHYLLDPGRRYDPLPGLRSVDKTYREFLSDVVKEYNICSTISYPFRLIKIKSSGKIYALDRDKIKHHIFNLSSFEVGRQMGLWGGQDMLDLIESDNFKEGESIIFVQP